MATQHAFEPIVPGERDALEPLAPEPGGAVLRAQRIGGEPRRIETEEPRRRLQRRRRVGEELLEVDHVHAVDPERGEPGRQVVGVAATPERHVLLVVGVEEVVGAEAVGNGQVVLERVRRRGSAGAPSGR